MSESPLILQINPKSPPGAGLAELLGILESQGSQARSVSCAGLAELVGTLESQGSESGSVGHHVTGSSLGYQPPDVNDGVVDVEIAIEVNVDSNIHVKVYVDVNVHAYIE